MIFRFHFREVPRSVNLAACLEHPEFQGLLTGAKAEPASDYPRVACADWLEVRGLSEPARRWRASLSTPFSRIPLTSHFTRMDVLPASITWRVAEGFLHAEAPETADWSQAGIWRPWPRVTRESVARVNRAASERQVAGLDLSRLLERGALPELLDGLPSSAASHFWLDDNGLVDAQMETLAKSQCLEGVRSLRLGRNRLTQQGVATLLRAPWAGGLVSLELEGNERMGAQGVSLLGRSAALAQLKRLHMAGCGGGDAGAFGLAEALSPWRIEELDIGSCGVSAEGIRALASSPTAAGLTRLELAGNHLSSAATLDMLKALADGPLARLGLANCWIGAPVIEALAAGEGPAGLVDLDIGHNGLREGRRWGLGGTHAAILANSPSMARLQSLSLAGMPWNAGMAAAMATKPFFHLHKLDLSNCRIGPAALPALLDSPWLADVRSLVLDDNPLGERGVALIAAHPGLAGVHELSLARCSIGDEGLRSLARSETLADLRRVDLRGQQFDGELLAESADRLGLAGAEFLARG